MTPRSQELFRSGQEALAASEVLLLNNLPARAVSDAYYVRSMLDRDHAGGETEPQCF
jgi:hypothetical protein